MLLPRDREDVMRHRHLWRDADALDRHLLQIIADATRSPTQQAVQLEAEEEEYLEVDAETGDTSLYRIDAASSKRRLVKTFARKGQRDFSTVDCYRCGRLGHFADHCTYESHKDGGPIRERKGVAKSDASGGKPAEAACVILSTVDICGVETAEDPWQVTDPWRPSGPTAAGKGADRQRRFDLMSLPETTGRRRSPEQYELSPPKSERPPPPPPRTPSPPAPPQLLEHAPPPPPLAPRRWPYESPFECKLCRTEGVYGQSCGFHRSNGLSTQQTDPVKIPMLPKTNAEHIGKAEGEPRKLEGERRPLSLKEMEWFEKNYPSTELDLEEAGSAVRTDLELCNFESDDEEKENFEPRKFEWGPGLRRNAFGVWVDTGFEPQQRSPLISPPSQVSDGCSGSPRTAEGRRDALRIPTKPAPMPTRIPKLRLAECFPRGAGGLAPPVRERWPPATDAADAEGESLGCKRTVRC